MGLPTTNNNSGKHPLLLPEILEPIMDLLDQESLGECRLVCKLWKDCSTVNYRSCSQVVINPRRLSREKFSSFQETMSSSSILPMSNVIFIHSDEASQLQEDFFRDFGGELSSVTLPAYQGSGSGFLALLQNILIHHCPNLQELCLTHVNQLDLNGNSQEAEDPLIFPESFVHNNLLSLKLSLGHYHVYQSPQGAYGSHHLFQALFSHLPNLEKLHISYKCSGEVFFGFLQILRDSSSSGGLCSNLQELYIEDILLDATHLRLLMEIGFPKLKKLSIDCFADNSPRTEELLESFLETVSSTLETLIFTGDIGSQRVFLNRADRCKGGLWIQLPYMPQLKVLESKCYEAFHFGPVMALGMDSVPKLREFIVSDEIDFGDNSETSSISVYRSLFDPKGLDKDEKEMLKTFNHPCVKVLRLAAPILPCVSQLKGIRKMIKCFPSLEEFHGKISLMMVGGAADEMLREIIKALSKAKGLKVLRLEFEDCQQLNTERVKAKWTEAFYMELGRFKKLQRLELSLADAFGVHFKLPLELKHLMSRHRSLTSIILEGF